MTVWWNYKSALLSALARGLIFFAVNLRAGRDAAVAAMLVEWIFRFATAGFYGALTQAVARTWSPRLRPVMTFLVIPGVAHLLELSVHTWRGTPEALRGVGVSILFTIVSTSFHVFAMRRGVFVAGAGAPSLADDLRMLPKTIGGFVVSPFRACRP